MGKWKKWLYAGLFTAMLGTAIIAGPTADVSANAGNSHIILKMFHQMRIWHQV